MRITKPILLVIFIGKWSSIQITFREGFFELCENQEEKPGERLQASILTASKKIFLTIDLRHFVRRRRMKEKKKMNCASY